MSENRCALLFYKIRSAATPIFFSFKFSVFIKTINYRFAQTPHSSLLIIYAAA